MYRTALRSASRPAVSGLRSAAVRAAPRRFASTASPDKSRTWKSAAARWGLAIAAVYYYNTSSMFSDEASPLAASAPYADNDTLTVNSLIEKKRKQASAKPVEPVEKKSVAPAAAVEEKSAESTKPDNKPETQPETQPQSAAALEGSPEALEQEAGQEGAFNPETGEINWDCPCLGGMAHGPCGEEFKTAFSCFVYSNEEPKGMECIEKFQGMQECFRQYPDIYGAELDDTESDEPAAEQTTEPPVAEYQQLRDEPPISLEQKSAAETDNLPGVKPVESATPTKPEETTAAKKEAVDEEKK